MTGSALSLLLGSQTPTSFSLPAGVVSTAPADAAIRQAAAAGLILDEWQQFVLRGALGVRSDGRWAAFSSCLLVPRQNGKGSVLEALALAALFQFDVELTVWTAHQMKTAKEGFRRLVQHIKTTPDLERQVASIRRGNDDRGIELKDGRRVQFLAREGGAGVGFTADLVIFDEAWKLDADTLANVIPTLSAVPNAQVWYTSSAPHESSSQLHALRRRAGSDPRLAFFEWSAAPEDDPRAEGTWAKTNPGYGLRIGRESVEAEWNELNADEDPARFCRERLGVPDPEPAEGVVGLIDWTAWEACQTSTSEVDSHRTEALVVSADRRLGWFAVAGRRADGRLHVEVGPVPMREVVERAVERWSARGVPLRSRHRWPELVERGVEMVEVSPRDYAGGVNMVVGAVEGQTLAHIGQRSLDAAVKVATLSGAGVWVGAAEVDAAPLEAVTLAVSGVPSELVEPPRVWSLADFPDLV